MVRRMARKTQKIDFRRRVVAMVKLLCRRHLHHPKRKVGDLVWVSDQVEAWVPASIASIDASLVRGTAQKSRHVPQRPSHLPESPSSSPNMRYSSLSKSTVSWAQQVYDEGQIVEVDLSTSFEKELSGRLSFSETVRGRAHTKKRKREVAMERGSFTCFHAARNLPAIMRG